MTWVAAEQGGTPIEGFEYGTRVTWNQTDGKVKTGRIIVQATDKIGDAHRIEDDENPNGELVTLSPMFVQRLSD